jgi:hypothetical protein
LCIECHGGGNREEIEKRRAEKKLKREELVRMSVRDKATLWIYRGRLFKKKFILGEKNDNSPISTTNEYSSYTKSVYLKPLLLLLQCNSKSVYLKPVLLLLQ